MWRSVAEGLAGKEKGRERVKRASDVRGIREEILFVYQQIILLERQDRIIYGCGAVDTIFVVWRVRQSWNRGER